MSAQPSALVALVEGGVLLEIVMNTLYYAKRYRASGGSIDRDLAHEADMRRQAREQLRLDCMDEEEAVPYEPAPLDEYEF